MTLDKQHDKFMVVCDNCDETLDLGTGDFDTAIARIREEGWLIRKGQRGWEHYCQECRDEEE